MGLAPKRHRERETVVNPIAVSAATMRYLLTVFRTEAAAAGISPRLVSADMARKPRMNHGKIFERRTLTPGAFDCAFFLRWIWIAANTRTAGMMARVRVSFTIVAKSPAASLNAYPVATTLDVSLTAVPAHSPNAASDSPIARPSSGKTTIITVSNKNVADNP